MCAHEDETVPQELMTTQGLQNFLSPVLVCAPHFINEETEAPSGRKGTLKGNLTL